MMDQEKKQTEIKDLDLENLEEVSGAGDDDDPRLPIVPYEPKDKKKGK